LYKSSS